MKSASDEKTTAAPPAKGPTYATTERAILEYALRQGTRSAAQKDAPAREVAKQAAPDPKGASTPTLEECVSVLRDTAEQLTRLRPAEEERWDQGSEQRSEQRSKERSELEASTDAAQIARARTLADRLRVIAKALLGYGDLIAITGRW